MPHISEAAPLQISRFYTGLFTYRNPLIVPIRQMGRRIIELYDAISDGANMEPTNRLTLARRPGYTTVNSNPLNGRPLWFYSFKPSSFPGQIFNVVDTTANIEYIQPGGAAPQQLLTKSVPTITNFSTVGAYMYMAHPNFASKWDGPAGPQGVTQWGIDISSVAGVLGPNSPTAAANLAIPPNAIPWANPHGIFTPNDGNFTTANLAYTQQTIIQGPNPPNNWSAGWTNPQNVQVKDGNLSTAVVNDGASLNFVAVTFAFNLPANATVTGIMAYLAGGIIQGGPHPPTWQLETIKLLKAGVGVGSNLGSTINIPSGYIGQYWGNPTFLWGTTWTPTDINNRQFGVVFQFKNSTGFGQSLTFGIDQIALQVYYIAPITGNLIASQILTATNFNFHISTVAATAKVTGIQVAVQGFETQGSQISLNVALMKNGNPYSSAPRNIQLPANDTTITLGGPGDLWGTSWAPGDIENAGFGVALQAGNASGQTATFSLDSVQVTVYGVGGPHVGLTSGTLTSQVGYFYVYCYGNAHSGHISSPTLPSVGSGPNGEVIPVNQGVTVQLEASPDPQVTDIHVYRTSDGGGQPYFELPTSPYPNVSQTITDEAPDNLLQVQNIAPLPHFNDPPPGGAVDPVWFAGRLWLHKGNNLYFASGPDITVGNGAEAWYPVYTFSVPNQIIRKYPTPNGMLLVCVDDIMIVRGISTASFTVNDFMKDIGQRTWTAGDSDGSNIYLYTSDRQFLLINPNGVTSVSGNIADTISAVDPTLAYVSMFRYTALENWIFLADGSTTIYPYNQELQAWATKQMPVNGVGAIGTVESSPGVYQFWRARPVANSTISYRDLTIFADEGQAYPCYAIFGPIPVADFLTLSQLRDVALAHVATTSNLTLSVLANEIFPVAGSQYEILQISSSEPPELSATPSLSYSANRYTWKSAPLPELVNLCFLRLDFSADPNPDELFTWTLGGSQTTGGSSLGQPGQLPQLQGR